MRNLYPLFLKSFFLGLLTLSICPTGQAQVYEGDLRLEFKSQLDTLSINYTEITGNLIIGDINNNYDVINDLSKLSNLDKIGGSLTIHYTDLTDLNDLSKLSQIGGYLLLESNNLLLNIDGLSQISIIPGNFNIIKNRKLQYLIGWPKLQEIHGNLYFESNPEMQYIDGFNGLVRLDGYFDVSNSKMSYIDGFHALLEIGNSLLIGGNGFTVFQLRGFNNLERINGNLSTSYSGGLEHINGLKSLQVIEGIFDIGNTSITNLDSLTNLRQVGDISFWTNAKLESIDGLSSLESVGQLYIFDCNKLRNLDGLSSLKTLNGSIYGALEIGDNAVLEDIDGLASLEKINGNFLVAGNPLLNGCCVLPIISQLATGKITIRNNGSNCSDLNNIDEKCKISTLYGKVYNDINENCQIDDQENGLPGWLIRVEPDGFVTRTDRFGNYSINVEKGKNYVVRQIVPADYQAIFIRPICPSSALEEINVDGAAEDTIILNFANQLKDCAQLSVDIVARAQRRCFNSIVDIKYQNIGTNDAQNVILEVSLPEFIIPQKSTIPWDRKEGQKLIFNLGTLASGESGQISLTDSVACVEEVRDLTRCIEVSISPKFVCDTIDNRWSKAELSITGQCVGDSSAHFEIKNTGSGAMTESQVYELHDRQGILLEGRFQLNPGETFPLDVPYSGQVLRLEVDQVPFHPDGGIVSAIVSNCDGVISSTDKAFFLAFPPSTPSFERHSACFEIVDSYDPNDKLVQPLGLTDQHYVDPGTSLDYTIRFQNTGSAEAINVRLVDTISASFNFESFRMLSASHDYELEISGQNPYILTWRFDNINLPDSTSNEPESHGYVRFTIAPVDTLPIGTRVENFADIFFDFNEPVRTNTTWTTFEKYRLPKSSNPVDSCSVPSQAQVGANQATCEVNTRLSATLPSSGLGQWELVKGAGMLENPRDIQSEVSNLGMGENIFRWSVGTDLCPANYADLTITRLPVPDQPQVENIENNRLRSSVEGNSYEWYLDGQILADKTRDIEAIDEGDYQVVVIQDICKSDISPIFAFQVTSLDNFATQTGLKMYPNPSSEELFIEMIQANDREVSVEILDVNGQLIFKEVYSSQLGEVFAQKLDLHRLNPGIYFIQIKNSKGASIQKIVLK